jgi:hypothetical protein
MLIYPTQAELIWLDWQPHEHRETGDPKIGSLEPGANIKQD